jgi:methanogenic corrinoid protein MtbC1
MRTAGGHRRIPRGEAIRYIREAHLPVDRPELLGLGAGTEVGADADVASESRALYEALHQGRRDEAIRIITSSFLGGRPLAWVFDELMRDALAEIGTLWEHGQEGIFIEHRAIDICISAVARLRGALPQPPADAPVAIGGAPANDPYLLPSQMVAAVLQDVGWQSINLGPDTPLDVLAGGANVHQAQLVWLSCSSDQAFARLKPRLGEFAESMAAHGRRLILGGRAGETRLSNDRIVRIDTMRELDAFARGVLAAR